MYPTKKIGSFQRFFLDIILLLTFFYIHFFILGNEYQCNPEPNGLSDNCIGCICEASTRCDVNTKCVAGVGCLFFPGEDFLQLYLLVVCVFGPINEYWTFSYIKPESYKYMYIQKLTFVKIWPQNHIEIYNWKTINPSNLS